MEYNEDFLNKYIGNKLKSYREIANLTQQQLADKLGVKQQNIARYELGQRTFKINIVSMMADFFNKQISDFLPPEYLENENIKGKNFEAYSLDEATVKIPVLGVIPAGTPMEAIEDILDYIEIPKDWLRGGKEYFALKLKGDSMFPKYNDGDIVIFRKTPDCNSGDEVCVLVNGFDATFKRLLKHDSGITLQPLNTAYEIKLYSNDDVKNLPIRVLGVAVEMRRKI